LINTYSVIFLIGTAFWSALRYSRVEGGKNRAIGNALITVGAILPGVGGGLAKYGIVEALYIGEFVGIILIYAGYKVCSRPAWGGSTQLNTIPSVALTSERNVAS
jgi:hypothetical protein